MNVHKNAKQTPRGQERLVRLVLSGLSPAAQLSTTACSWRPSFGWPARVLIGRLCQMILARGTRAINASTAGADRTAPCPHYKGLYGVGLTRIPSSTPMAGAAITDWSI